MAHKTIQRRRELCPDNAAARLRKAIRPLTKNLINTGEFMARFDTPLEASAPGGKWTLDLPGEFKLVMTRKDLEWDRLDWEVPVDVFSFTLGILRDEWDVQEGYTEGNWQWHIGPRSTKSTRELTAGRDPKKYPGQSEMLGADYHEITSSMEVNVLFPEGYQPVAYVSSLQGEKPSIRPGGALYGCEKEMLEDATYLRDEAVKARDETENNDERKRFNHYRRHFDRMIRDLSEPNPTGAGRWFLHANRGILPAVAGLHICHDAGVPAYAIGLHKTIVRVHSKPRIKPYPIYTTAVELLQGSSGHNVAVAGVDGEVLSHLEERFRKECGFELRENPSK